MKAKILIVDDDPAILEATCLLFSDTYEVILAASGPEAVDKVPLHPDIACVVLDIRMAKMDGFETERRIKALGCVAPIVFNTGFPGTYTQDQVVREHQPFDYVEKKDGPQRLRAAVEAAVLAMRLRSDTEYLRKHARVNYGMVGRSPAMLKVFREIEQIARSDGKVMIFGETGTGKGAAAEAIHRRSARPANQLHKYVCSPRETDLTDSELFGHAKGAYTGTVADRMGLFESANGGTVFLDEIADLNLPTQNKLLRVLESGEIQRLGENRVRTVNVRVICATNKNLEEAVKNRTFREDLYFRLRGVVLRMPALRHRREDILELVDYFTERHCCRSGIDIKLFDPAARGLFVEYDWPGNVHELTNVVQSLIDSTPSYLITRQEVESILRPQGFLQPDDGSYRAQLKNFKRVTFIRGLDRCGRNVAQLARELRMDPGNLRKMIRSLDLDSGENNTD